MREHNDMKGRKPMKKRVNISMLLIICLSLLVISCRSSNTEPFHLQSAKSPMAGNAHGKPVIVILIDSIMDKPMQEAMRKGRAPALQFLKRNGQYFPRVVSSFPTMSVTIDSTLLTGTYADQHHVPGLVWYSSKEKRMIYYGNGPKEALKIDQLQVFLDAVHHLNQVQLNKQTKTIHEELAEKGKESASINATIFRGKTEHTLQVPRWAAVSTPLPQQIKITGPKLFSFAALTQLDPGNRHTRIWKKYGMNDQFSAQELAFLIQQNKLPNLSFAYFPENDMAVHRKDINYLGGIEKADQALQVVLNAFGSWEQAIQQATWIVMGDSGQSHVIDDRQKAIVDLRPLLDRYRIAKINRPIQPDDQIVLSSNERMAYVYAIDDKVSLSKVVQHLQKEGKLDIIAWKVNETIEVTAGNSRKKFSYRRGGTYKDEYGQSWTLSGDPGLMDIKISANNRIQYGKYPDVLARLYGAMNSHEGRYVVVTIKPGYELVAENSPTHLDGGAHGSLHEKDSLVPLFVAGTNTRPKTLRIVDMKDWILQLVNEREP
jgi:predicted AlkP superfamily pyrophosphatase or phosphodiesterase